MVTYLSGNRIQGSSTAGVMNTCTGFTNEYDASVGDGNIRATKIEATVSGSVTSLSCDLQNATGNVALGLYADNSGVPNTRLGYTASTTVVAGVNTVALIAPVSITSGTVYWISVETSNGNNIKLTFSQASGTTYYKGSTYGTPPSPFGSASAHTTGLQVCLVSAGTDEKASFVTAGTSASTGWTTPSGFTLTSGTGITVSLSNEDSAVYDLGTSGQMTPDDDWVCDYTLTRNSSDVFDHPMLMIKDRNVGYGSGTTDNGDNQILLQYWANGASGSGGSNNSGVRFRVGGSEIEVNSQQNYQQAVGVTLYYRNYMTARVVGLSAWTSDALRTAEGSSGRVINHTSSSTLDNRWDQSDPLRYIMVINRNGNAARWTISDFKFWNGTASTGVANNMLSHTPTVAFNFTDVPATINLPAGVRYEQTNDRKIFRFTGGAWVEKGS
jgi:hypothetical protein